MIKRTIDFSDLENPLETFNFVFGFTAHSLSEFFNQLREVETPMIVELKNCHSLANDLKGLVELFENISQKNKYVYVIRGIQ